ncbi:MAG: M42 family metallopeptidase [Mesorhizobium sp.]|uniref:hypothetical protein n=1 Tax=Mesorhizobium sp. TaxID=1871066 RepID=UPI000F763DCD|nr:hypothetical protein EJ068_20470 [Mesorhizobium sp. M2A.F.Ca.ET.043.02.1.1]RUW42178.1 hypothetical protein EOA37_06380 [Mesorhizobium sp. M2A.F.Ca.ET.015.02.1.1]RUW81345.1 hypothetical protein EOA28_01620 [Mesorhizobium sp. M2A.F.Ca.ET.067.02.1.1]RVC96096.1 hypothetical protein EN739_10250 [Mesorhizobium sp. M2A.F.Ca.ET.017.03.2.1]RWB49474.1 MAG: hypothetical protein EOQ46_04120 [Mesorhizobium sp.]
MNKLATGDALGRERKPIPQSSRCFGPAAEEENIPFQIQSLGSSSPTDARAIQETRGGVASGVLSVPVRYMHTPPEVLCLDDVQATVDLVCAYCRRLTPELDFTPE